MAVRIASDPLRELVFREGSHSPVYLVGGNLRDVLLNRRSRDRDFAVEGPVEVLALRIASLTGGKIVVLGKRDLFRIVLSDGSTLDFSAVKDDIATDLKQRDFTINALGWSPEGGIFDPTKGLVDLENRIIRMTGRQNLQSDPLRIIRAYRLAGELDLTIEPETRKALRELSPHIATSKSERITLEFFKILNLQKPSNMLIPMLEDGVLQHIIMPINNDLRGHIRVLSRIGETIDVLPLKQSMRLSNVVSQNLLYSGFLYLQSLLLSCSRTHLSLSRKIKRHLDHLLAGKKAQHKAEEEGREFHDILFDLLGVLESSAEDFFILAGRLEYLSDCDRYRQIARKSLLSTGEIMKCAGLRPGKEVGRAIEVIRRAQFYRKIKNKREAADYLLEHLREI